MKRRRQVSDESPQTADRQQMLRKSKRRTESSTDPWNIPVEFYSQIHLCHKLYDAIRTLKNEDNQLLSEFVVRLPNRRSVPEYYNVVSHPIDLLKVQQKLKTDEYLTVPLFISDIQLLIENAKLYYKVSSMEFQRTTALESEFLRILQEFTSSEGLKSPLSPKTVSLKLSSLHKTPVLKTPVVTVTGSSTKKAPTSVKATRSKAWLDEFITSEDPIKIYFADVFSYHDGSGEYISQPFIELPSEKDYPEYYHIITEPIGLASIKDQIDAGMYHNLKQIQDDLLLMIKNAQYFNEPHSNIYKMASSLRKVIINRCLELEKKYKTVEKTTKLKSPSPSQKYCNDNDSESDYISSESECEMETESENKKLLLHVKHDKLGANKDPVAKLLKAKSPPPLKKVLSALYQSLIYARDEDGRVMSDLFMKRPSPKLYPEYYIVIDTPIDFKEINSKIKKESYKSLSEMITDVELLVGNAVTFNEEYSQIHTDALALRAIFHTSIEQLQIQWPHHFAGTHKKSTSKENKITTISTLFAVVKNCIDSTGRKLSLSFQEPPKELEGHGSGKKVLGLISIAEKVENNSYESVHELFTDLCSLYNRYCETSSLQSSLFKDAVSLHRVTVSKYNELTDEQRNAFRYPNAIETVKNFFRDFMNALIEVKGDGDRILKEVFYHVEVTEITDETKSKRLLSLEKVHQWVELGRYVRLDQLQRDILFLFKQGHQMEIDEVSHKYEKLYIELRNDFFSHFLSSPAYQERTLEQVEKELLEEEKEEEGKDRVIDASVTLVIPPVSKRTTVKYFQIGEVTYFPGDFIYLPPQEPHLPPQIALIELLWTDSHGNAWFNGCWFFRPHETFHIATRKFYEQEVFKSDFYSCGQLNTTLGKCYVLFIKEYTKFFPQGFSEEDVYVCESRYHVKYKNFKRIKFWNVQENVCIKLLPRLSNPVLNKVPSVFATQTEVKSSEYIDASLTTDTVDEEDVTKTEEESEMNSSEGSLEASFFRELKDVSVSVSNPEANCTYFEQYCIDDKVFKLGDFVCVRSDQELPFIARIDRMWTDSNDDPWFRGPWFLRVKEVHHLPTFMFYEKELLMSNIHDSNPMRSIMRKCAVLYLSDYIKWRPTEIPETDVYVCDSKYNEEEKQIKKMKSLKGPDPVSSLVLQDEKYYFPEDLFLWKCHSPKLYPPAVPITTTSTPISSTMTTNTTIVNATPPHPPVAPLPAVSVSGNQVTLSLQQLQSLLTSPLINQRLIQQQQPPPIVSPQVPSESSVLSYPCMWENCTDTFTNIADLGSHIVRSNHIKPEPDGIHYYCYWSYCLRKKNHGGKPFDSLHKITRHVKEVHLLKIHPQVTLTKPSLTVSPTTKDQKKTPPTVNVSSLPSLITPFQAALSVPPTTQSPSPAATNPMSLIQPLRETATTSINSTSETVPPTDIPPVSSDSPDTITETLPSIFVEPPNSQKEIYHSNIYLNYIERMRNNEDTISPQPPKFPQNIGSEAHHVSQWIDPKAIPEGMTTSEALFQLYHHMISDAVNISNWLDTVQ